MADAQVKRMNSSPILESLLSDEQRRQDAEDERRARLIQLMLIVILLILIGTWIWGAIYSLRQPNIRRVTIGNAQVVGTSDLCPGELLFVQFDFHADGAGDLVEKSTIWSDTPPKTLVYSESQEFLLDDTLDQPETRAWDVPQTYRDNATGQVVPLAAGEYRRLFSVSSPSRSTVFAMGSVEFSVRENCP